MNKFKFYFILLIATLSLFSCNTNNDTITTVEEKAYSVQEPLEKATIEDYLNSYYIFSVDEDLSITFAPLTKTGKIKTLIDSPIITGIGTSFTKELAVGDDLYNTDKTTKIGTILEINSDTQITLTTNASFSTVVDVPIRCCVIKTTINDQKIYPIKTKTVALHGIEYTVKYLVLREGTGTAPTNTDAVLTAYKGFYLQSSTTDSETTITDTDFEEVKYPSSFFSLLNVVRGWSELFPLFKSGTYSGIDDGSVSYKDFGAGVLFIPSGLGYYNYGSGSIPGYAPLVFSFKLYDVYQSDTDGDGIPNYQEDLNNDGYLYSFTNTILYPTTADYPDNVTRYVDDTDNDGIPNYLDNDDDGDNYTTAYEILKGTNYLEASSHP
jgi:FKBP-type peptidyl-prolyl cis-trans isomerase